VSIGCELSVYETLMRAALHRDAPGASPSGGAAANAPGPALVCSLQWGPSRGSR